ncbi:Target of Nesh-SH3 [Acipenser ruthenus]|uniref:Target of Nesh-SH3 n=1 Tax=Acipenser ruthenus TaxID=7906 RepID=A0A662YTJ1_ACIRT|nr:Target of Nesh-SH3 [Acipenser ruthenus]
MSPKGGGGGVTLPPPSLPEIVVLQEALHPPVLSSNPPPNLERGDQSGKVKSSFQERGNTARVEPASPLLSPGLWNRQVLPSSTAPSGASEQCTQFPVPYCPNRACCVRPVKRQNLKVRINATGDTIVLKFVRPRPDMKLEGFILGYGSSMFSKQYIQLPENGKPYETEVDAEPKYLIAVQPIPDNDVKKQCTGQVNLQKPLHLIIGSVTPSSVLLSWGTFLKTPFEGNIMNDCLEDGHYTVRYREKERNKKWNYENCPISDTVIDRLKPNTKYEFGVRASKGKQDGLWSKPIVHQTNAGSPDKIKGQIDNPGNKIIIDQLRKPQLPDITGLNNRKTIHRTRNPPRLANGDGRILPNGERRILPNGEGRILPNGERHILPNGEGRILPNGERHILPNGERHILPNGERHILPNGEGRILPNGERHILPNGERRILPNGERRILPNGEGRVPPNGEGRILPNGEGRILPNGERRILPNGERHILPNGEGRILPNGERRILPNGEGRILPKPFNATQRHTHYWGNGDVSCFIMYIA